MLVFLKTKTFLNLKLLVILLSILYLLVNFEAPTVLDLGLISIVSQGPRASTKVESHVNFTESRKV